MGIADTPSAAADRLGKEGSAAMSRVMLEIFSDYV